MTEHDTRSAPESENKEFCHLPTSRGSPIIIDFEYQILTPKNALTPWNTSCIIFSHLKLIKVHFCTLFWHFGCWTSPNAPKSRPRGPYPPRQIRKFWVNGSKFWNSVKSTWKYTKIAAFYVQTGKNPDFDLWPPPIALTSRRVLQL